MIGTGLVAVLAAITILASLVVSAVPSATAAAERVVYIAAIEPKGGVTVDKEPFPGAELPKGGGYVKTPPNAAGRWEVSAYQFSPATVVVQQGDRVTLEVVGINGAKHSMHVERYHPHHVVVKRGEITRLQFTADVPGIFKIHCEEHQPAMEGTLVVLPR